MNRFIPICALAAFLTPAAAAAAEVAVTYECPDKISNYKYLPSIDALAGKVRYTHENGDDDLSDHPDGWEPRSLTLWYTFSGGSARRNDAGIFNLWCRYVSTVENGSPIAELIIEQTISGDQLRCSQPTPRSFSCSAGSRIQTVVGDRGIRPSTDGPSRR